MSDFTAITIVLGCFLATCLFLGLCGRLAPTASTGDKEHAQ